MRIIALLFALILTGCSGNRLNAETKPTAVALSAPSIAATFAATVMAALADQTQGRDWRGAISQRSR
jgi:hypothetical protein